MDSENRDGRKGTPWAKLTLMLVAYMLSPGPFVWLMGKMDIRGYPSIEVGLQLTLIVIYAPIGLLSEMSESFKNLMSWYVSLWIP